MSCRVSILVLCILLIPCSAFAVHHVWPMGDDPGMADCAVAMDPGGIVVVAWSAEGEVHSAAMHGDQWFGEINHGPGVMPELCWYEGRFLLAYAVGGAVQVRESIPWALESWSDEALFPDEGSPVLSLSLTGWQPTHEGGNVYIAWETEDGWIRCVQGNAAGAWTPTQPVVQIENFEPKRPRIAPGFVTRLYYLETDQLIYRDGIWGTAQVVPGNYGVDFEVATGPEGQHCVLALGPQPVCPCNIILYTEQSFLADWTDPEPLTRGVDFYDWPRFPRLGVDAEGRAHAFWYQRAADNMMNETMRTLHYFVLDEGTWSDESAELEGHVGTHGDLAMDGWGEASMVWMEPGDPEDQIWLASSSLISSSEPAPGIRITLTASPNPFNPRTEILFTLPDATGVALSVRDVSGRHVRTLAVDEVFPAGASTVKWDGRDDSDRPLASGVYLVEMRAFGERRGLRAVLLK